MANETIGCNGSAPQRLNPQEQELVDNIVTLKPGWLLARERLDFSAFDKLVKLNPDAAASCIRHLSRLGSSICHSAGNTPSCFKSFNDNLQERYPILFDDNSSNSRRSVRPGEYSFSSENDARAARELTNSCGQRNWSDEYLSATFIEDHLPTVLANTEHSCRDNIEKIYARRLADIITETARMDPDDPEIDRLLDGAGRASDLFYRTLVSQYGLERAHPLNALSCLPYATNQITQMWSFVMNLRDAANCTQYEIGPQGERRFDYDRSASESGVEMRHNVIRRDQNTYLLGLNLNFTGQGSDNARYSELTRQCLTQYNRHLKGPNGEQIVILINEQYPGTRPVQTDINIVRGENVRSHSRGWAHDIDCPTVLHELLHLVGLCDEYRETAIGYIVNPDGTRTSVERGADITAFDCRAIGHADSIMVNPYEAVKRTNRTQASLLYPAHARVILYPGCRRINSTYFDCASNFQRTSSQVTGSEASRCNYTDPICREPGAWSR
jgi:hypothetical protein